MRFTVRGFGKHGRKHPEFTIGVEAPNVADAIEKARAMDPAVAAVPIDRIEVLDAEGVIVKPRRDPRGRSMGSMGSTE